MKRYKAALPLYLRSISISIAIFGPAFSGLEYDYRGLMHLYSNTDKMEGYHENLLKLQDWIELRKRCESKDEADLVNPSGGKLLPTATVIQRILGQYTLFSTGLNFKPRSVFPNGSCQSIDLTQFSERTRTVVRALA
eukprot:sb/3474509/